MNILLDTLGDAKTSLSTMLTSKYVKPLREEAATWSLKLDEVSEVLQEVSIVKFDLFFFLIFCLKESCNF